MVAWHSPQYWVYSALPLGDVINPANASISSVLRSPPQAGIPSCLPCAISWCKSVPGGTEMLAP